MAQKIVTLQLSAESAEQLEKMAAVIRNVAQKVSPEAFCNVLYPKIKSNPDFFKSVVNNPMLKFF